MNAQMLAATRVAHEIEWMCAKRIAEAKSRGRYKHSPGTEFDAHAATELADLIFKRMTA